MPTHFWKVLYSPARRRAGAYVTGNDSAGSYSTVSAAQLKEGGVHTALDLARLDPAVVRRRWSVVLERTVRELRGMACIGLDQVPPSKREIACTRSFGPPVTALADLSEAVIKFASRAAHTLRRQASLACQVLVFIRTSPFRSDPQYSRSIIRPLRRPSADTAAIVSAALAGLRAIYRPGFKLTKAGVMLLELQPATLLQHELGLKPGEARGKESLMSTLDNLNDRYGRGTVSMASAGLAGDRRAWSMKQERRTPAYTTCLADMPTSRA